MSWQQDEIDSVHQYLDDKSVSREDGTGRVLSLVGRIKELEFNYLVRLSKLESDILNDEQH